MCVNERKIHNGKGKEGLYKIVFVDSMLLVRHHKFNLDVHNIEEDK